jgi:hypothetical protein
MEWDKTSQTKYRFDIQYSDDAVNETITNFEFGFATSLAPQGVWSTLQSNNTYVVDNGNAVNYVDTMEWTDWDGYTVKLSYSTKAGYTEGQDFFKIKVGNIEDRIKAYKDSN